MSASPSSGAARQLIVPFAATLSEAGRFALRETPLPNLARLLARLQPGARLGSDEFSSSPPHEAALAAAWGWQGESGGWPFAARAAAADGIAVGERAWGLLSPVHWAVGRDRITLAEPALLALEADESRAFFEAVRELFESEGFTLAWGAPLRWYAAHESLAALPTASLDRVVGRNVDRWLPEGRAARLLRRLQNEVQMLLYTHALNDHREAQGRPAVNALWLSGCGRFQPADESAVALDDRLRAPLLAEDWAAWREAWRALDAGPLAALRQRVEASEPGLALTLCGERLAQRWDAVPTPWWQRLAQRLRPAPEPAAALEAL